ncbi:hypothetical protein BGX38DRAFT_1271589 [Terfezia claveryi]|nr:hypothetical protein BGX38DRAFT_1271589 [Terfezia claveryi]
MSNWEYAVGRIDEERPGEGWHIHPSAKPPFHSNAQVPYRRLRPSCPEPEPSLTQVTIRHRKRKATDYDFPNSFAVRRPSIFLTRRDSQEEENSGIAVSTGTGKPLGGTEEPFDSTEGIQTQGDGNDGTKEIPAHDFLDSEYPFHFTVSCCIASSDPNLDVFAALRERCQNGTLESPRIDLHEPIGEAIARTDKWCIVEDYMTILNPDEPDESFEITNGSGYVPPRHAYMGYKFISPKFCMLDVTQAFGQISRFFSTILPAEDGANNEQKLLVYFTPSSYIHVHIEAFKDEDCDWVAKFCLICMLFEDIFSTAWNGPNLSEKTSPLTQSMWAAWEKRWWREHPNHNPKDTPSIALDLVKRMIGLTETYEVALVFNGEDQDMRKEFQTYGAEDRLRTDDNKLWQHISGRVEVVTVSLLPPVESSGMETEHSDGMVDKYYKVNFGYAYFNHGTVEFREFPAPSLEWEGDILFWVNFCMWLLYISKEIAWRELTGLGRLKDLCNKTETPHLEYMWTALFGVLGDLNGGDPYYYAMAERFARKLYTIMKRRHDEIFVGHEGVFTDQMIKAFEPMTLLEGDNLHGALERGRIAGTQGFIYNLCLVVNTFRLEGFVPPETPPESPLEDLELSSDEAQFGEEDLEDEYDSRKGESNEEDYE